VACSTSAQNKPFSAIPRNSVTRTCPPSASRQIPPWRSPCWNWSAIVEGMRFSRALLVLLYHFDISMFYAY